MYLRLPWVVGNAGLFGAFLVIALASGLTRAGRPARAPPQGATSAFRPGLHQLVR
ncbi:MAG: hypothetical protein AMXMBFR53_31410 [Gemmatimonadota bacterium]